MWEEKRLGLGKSNEGLRLFYGFLITCCCVCAICKTLGILWTWRTLSSNAFMIELTDSIDTSMLAKLRSTGLFFGIIASHINAKGCDPFQALIAQNENIHVVLQSSSSGSHGNLYYCVFFYFFHIKGRTSVPVFGCFTKCIAWWLGVFFIDP